MSKTIYGYTLPSEPPPRGSIFGEIFTLTAWVLLTLSLIIILMVGGTWIVEHYRDFGGILALKSK